MLPPIPAAAVIVKAVMPTGSIVMENALASLPVSLVAPRVKFAVPAAVGVPEITPVVSFSVKPSGKLPLSTAHVMGVSPVAARVAL